MTFSITTVFTSQYNRFTCVVYVCLCVSSLIHGNDVFMCIMFIGVCDHVHTCIVFMSMYVCLFICMYLFLYLCLHVHVHMCVHKCMFTDQWSQVWFCFSHCFSFSFNVFRSVCVFISVTSFISSWSILIVNLRAVSKPNRSFALNYLIYW